MISSGSIAKGKVVHGSEVPRASLPKPEQIKFVLDPATQTAITLADNAFKALTEKHQLYVQAYMGYGKNLIKKFKVGPDAYVQMIIQLAFYLVHGRSAPTYESGTTRMFLNGRTEVCRTVSNQSVAFVKAMTDPSVPQKEKLELARAAIASHTAYMAEAVKGHGVDRHLLGLKLSLKPDEPMPEFFKDPSFATSSHWNLSTSQLSSEHFDGYGWGEVVSDGYGIAYMVKANSLSFNVVALSPHANKKSEAGEITPEASKMKVALGKSADLIRDVFMPTLPANL